MLDLDLAQLYGVETRALNQAVKRNAERFPPDFMFALTREEIGRISQFVISSGRTSLKFSKRVSGHGDQLRLLAAAIDELRGAAEAPRKEIGFRPG